MPRNGPEYTTIKKISPYIGNVVRLMECSHTYGDFADEKWLGLISYENDRSVLSIGMDSNRLMLIDINSIDANSLHKFDRIENIDEMIKVFHEKSHNWYIDDTLMYTIAHLYDKTGTLMFINDGTF